MKEFFFSEVIKWFNNENGTSFSFELLFGKLSNEFNPSLPPLMLKKLNYVFLFAKHYIYTYKLRSEDFEEFTKKLEIKYCTEGFYVNREIKSQICPDKSRVSYGI